MTTATTAAHFTLNGKTHIATAWYSEAEADARYSWNAGNHQGGTVSTACRLSLKLRDGQLDGPGVRVETTCGNCKRSKLGKTER